MIRKGDKVRSLTTGKTYVVADFNDRYRHIDASYVEKYRQYFEKVGD